MSELRAVETCIKMAKLEAEGLAKAMKLLGKSRASECIEKDIIAPLARALELLP